MVVVECLGLGLLFSFAIVTPFWVFWVLLDM